MPRRGDITAERPVIGVGSTGPFPRVALFPLRFLMHRPGSDQSDTTVSIGGADTCGVAVLSQNRTRPSPDPTDAAFPEV